MTLYDTFAWDSGLIQVCDTTWMNGFMWNDPIKVVGHPFFFTSNHETSMTAPCPCHPSILRNGQRLHGDNLDWHVTNRIWTLVLSDSYLINLNGYPCPCQCHPSIWSSNGQRLHGDNLNWRTMAPYPLIPKGLDFNYRCLICEPSYKSRKGSLLMMWHHPMDPRFFSSILHTSILCLSYYVFA